MQSDQCKTVYFSSLQFQVSGFRFQTLARADVISAYMYHPTHAACYSHILNPSRRRPDAHHLPKIHSQSTWVSISGFNCISAYEPSDFRKYGCTTLVSDFTSVFRFQGWCGSEIEIESSISDFRFQTRTRERNRNREFHFNFGFRLQSRLSGETKSNLEMNSGFHFDFKTELSMTPRDGRRDRRHGGVERVVGRDTHLDR